MDLVSRKVLELGSCRVRKVEGEVMEDEIIPLRPAGPARKPVVVEPKAGIHFPRVLGNVGGRMVPLRYVHAMDWTLKTRGPGGSELTLRSASLS